MCVCVSLSPRVRLCCAYFSKFLIRLSVLAACTAQSGHARWPHRTAHAHAHALSFCSSSSWSKVRDSALTEPEKIKIKKNRNAQLLSMATAGRVWKSRRDWILFWNFNRRRLRCRSLTVKVPRSDLVCRRLSLARMLAASLCNNHTRTHPHASVSVVLMYALYARRLCIIHRIGTLALGLRGENVTASVA